MQIEDIQQLLREKAQEYREKALALQRQAERMGEAGEVLSRAVKMLGEDLASLTEELEGADYESDLPSEECSDIDIAAEDPADDFGPGDDGPFSDEDLPPGDAELEVAEYGNSVPAEPDETLPPQSGGPPAEFVDMATFARQIVVDWPRFCAALKTDHVPLSYIADFYETDVPTVFKAADDHLLSVNVCEFAVPDGKMGDHAAWELVMWDISKAPLPELTENETRLFKTVFAEANSQKQIKAMNKELSELSGVPKGSITHTLGRLCQKGVLRQDPIEGLHVITALGDRMGQDLGYAS